MASPKSVEEIEAFAAPVGRLVIGCTKLDAQLTNLIGAITEMSIYHAVIAVHHQQFTSKVDTFLALLHTALDEVKAKPITDMINRAKEISDYRSRLAHSIWSFDEVSGNAVTVKFSARKKFARSRQFVDIPEIEATAREAFALSEKLESLARHLRKEMEGPDEPDDESPATPTPRPDEDR